MRQVQRVSTLQTAGKRVPAAQAASAAHPCPPWTRRARCGAAKSVRSYEGGRPLLPACATPSHTQQWRLVGVVGRVRKGERHPNCGACRKREARGAADPAVCRNARSDSTLASASSPSGLIAIWKQRASVGSPSALPLSTSALRKARGWQTRACLSRCGRAMAARRRATTHPLCRPSE